MLSADEGIRRQTDDTEVVDSVTDDVATLACCCEVCDRTTLEMALSLACITLDALM